MHVSSWIGYFPLLMVLFAMWRRSRAVHLPVKGDGRALLWPAFGVATGIPFVLLHPDGHVGFDGPAWQVLAAVLVGLLFAAPLVHLTAYERRPDGQIYQREGGRLLLVFGILIVVRFVMRFVFREMDPFAESALFFFIVVTYIVTWRVASFLKFRRVWGAAA